MAYNNNIYGNAAFTGALAGLLSGRGGGSSTAADYAKVCNAAAAIASEVDSLIPFDALVTTGAAITQLAITTNTIAANEQWRAGLLQQLAKSQLEGRYSEDSTAADYAQVAAQIVAAWTQGLTKLVTP